MVVIGVQMLHQMLEVCWVQAQMSHLPLTQVTVFFSSETIQVLADTKVISSFTNNFAKFTAFSASYMATKGQFWNSVRMLRK